VQPAPIECYAVYDRRASAGSAIRANLLEQAGRRYNLHSADQRDREVLLLA